MWVRFRAKEGDAKCEPHELGLTRCGLLLGAGTWTSKRGPFFSALSEWRCDSKALDTQRPMQQNVQSQRVQN